MQTMISLYILYLSIPLCYCLNACDILAPNGQFTGIGVHHHWRLEETYDSHYEDVYTMNSRDKLFWFNVTFSDNTGWPEISLVMNKTSATPQSVIKRFSIKHIYIVTIDPSYESYECITEYNVCEN